MVKDEFLDPAEVKNFGEYCQFLKQSLAHSEDEDELSGRVSTVCESLPQILLSCSLRQCRNKLLDLLDAILSQKNPKWTNDIIRAIDKSALRWKKSFVTKNLAQLMVNLLRWSTLVGVKCEKEQLSKIPATQAILLSQISSLGNKKLNGKAQHLLKKMWSELDSHVYRKALLALEPSPESIILISFWMSCSGNSDKEMKSTVLDMLVKAMINVKTPPKCFVVVECEYLLSNLTCADFVDKLLPAMHKGMLRNPEIIMECVGCILLHLSVDLSSHASQLGKSFAAHLCARNAETRSQAVNSLGFLVSKCRSFAPLEELLKHVFAIYNGSEGKLTTAEQKISVLQGLAAFTENDQIYLESRVKMANLALVYLGKILKVEVHERTVIEAVKTLKMWLYYGGAGANSPDGIFIDGLASKHCTNLVASAYLDVMNECYGSSIFEIGEDLIPLVVKSIEKAVAQPTSVNAVCEGLLAAYLVLRMDFQQNLQSVKADAAIRDESPRNIFLQEAVLREMLEESLVYVLQYCEHFFRNYRSPAIAIKAMLFCATCASHEIRRLSLEKLTRMPFALAENFLNEFSEYLKKGNGKREMNGEAKATSGGGMAKAGASKYLASLLVTISKRWGNYPREFGLKLFLTAHHPKLPKGLWLKIAKKEGVDAKVFVSENEGELKKALVDDYGGDGAAENALAMALSLNTGGGILEHCLQRWCLFFGSEELLSVTEEEVKILRTPDGVLCNKAVIGGGDGEGSLQEKNLKRESKAYSFKEQQEELQLRKELEEKKRKEGKVEQPKLTPKQRELLKAELEKESGIRARLKALKAGADDNFRMIAAAVRGNPIRLSINFRRILPVILKNLPSLLVGEDCARMFLHMRTCVFKGKDSLGLFLAQLTLRYAGSVELYESWSVGLLREASLKALDLIGTCETFPPPTFCYFFCFMQRMMLSKEVDSVLLMDSLKIIISHAERAKADDGNPTLTPEALPRKELLELLLIIVGKTGGYLQQSASNALVSVAKTCADGPGCKEASFEEVESLLKGLESVHAAVRVCSLKGLMEMKLPKFGREGLEVAKRIWIARFDGLEGSVLADDLWLKAGMECDGEAMVGKLMEDVTHKNDNIQKDAARALTAWLKDAGDETLVRNTTDKLISIYEDKLQKIPAVKNAFGQITQPERDLWQERKGVALAMEHAAQVVSPDAVVNLTNFYVSIGLADRDEGVQGSMLAASVALVNTRGMERVNELWPIFERFLKKTPSSPETDSIRAGVIVLMGCLAKHLAPEDPKLKPILNKLLDALNTPSQQVQEAVANCLPAVTNGMDPEEGMAILKKLIQRLLNASSYGERKGAAYGIAGMNRALGMRTFGQSDTLPTLLAAIQDKKNYRHREGALFTFEMLCRDMGKLFEPYLVNIIPPLLLCFGDSSEYVRIAADDCAKVLMGNLSVHGVKLVLPALLKGLEDDSWRTKAGSVELLGSMAYCAPRQLSACLPNVVPKLIEVLNDSHVKVQEAGTSALRVIGSVIQNPEIQEIVHVLLDALQDPSNKISVCMSTLLSMKFVHFIDAPSLALIMPVVQRAFVDRSTETRKMAAQIIGNMYSLTNEKDLSPYLPNILPGLKSSLLDPDPEVRGVSARALGAMMKGMGESGFGQIYPWLVTTISSEVSSVDRSGAAQGLAEVIGGLGTNKLAEMMPVIVLNSSRNDVNPHVKDGYLMMYIYLPVVFHSNFTPYIGQIIGPILKALADENEFVRETALKAGRRIVGMYAESAIQILLPELERGLFDDNWRIRLSSIHLVGDLLFRISGVTGKMSTETANEDDNFGTEHSQKIITNTLGEDRRNTVLAGLYMCRSDVSLPVRQASLHVWKVVVSNTPRTLREILVTLFGLLLKALASSFADKREMGARTLGDLVKKLGERVLPEIIPLLEKGLESDNARQRQGVCVGLSEIIASTSRDMVLVFVGSFVPTIRKTLYDDDPAVRKAAAKTFEKFHSSVGIKALDDVLPFMLEQMKSEDAATSEKALDGLRQVMAVKSRVVLPYLIPQLIASPINTKALAILASVAGDSLTKYLHKILPALLSVVECEERMCEMEYCQAVILAVTDEDGIRIIMDHLQTSTKSENPITRRSAIHLLSAFCASSKGDYSQYAPPLLRIFIHLLLDDDPEVLQLSWKAIDAVVKSLSGEDKKALVAEVRQAIKQAAAEVKEPPDGGEKLLPGFCTGKGVVPLIPIYREAMIGGNADEKVQGVIGLGEAVKLSDSQTIVASIMTVTGPLIRVIGERFLEPMKLAVLESIAIMLDKVGSALRQFFPQLQSTFVKSLTDPSRQVRLKGAKALAIFARYHTKGEMLFQEWLVVYKSADDMAVKETLLHTLRGFTILAGPKLPDLMRRQLFIMLRESLGNPEESLRITAAAALACLIRFLSPEQKNVLLGEHLLANDKNVDKAIKHGRSACLFVGLKENAEYIYTGTYADRVNRTLISLLQSDKPQLLTNGLKGCCYLFYHLMMVGREIPASLLTPFIKSMNNESNDTKQLVARICLFLAKSREELSPEFVKVAIPMLVNGTKEKNGFVKANCEVTLIVVLKLKAGDDCLKKYAEMLELGAKEALNDVVSKVLKRRMLTANLNAKEEDLDDTLLAA